jgi:hypothetical protein
MKRFQSSLSCAGSIELAVLSSSVGFMGDNVPGFSLAAYAIRAVC